MVKRKKDQEFTVLTQDIDIEKFRPVYGAFSDFPNQRISIIEKANNIVLICEYL